MFLHVFSAGRHPAQLKKLQCPRGYFAHPKNNFQGFCFAREICMREGLPQVHVVGGRAARALTSISYALRAASATCAADTSLSIMSIACEGTGERSEGRRREGRKGGKSEGPLWARFALAADFPFERRRGISSPRADTHRRVDVALLLSRALRKVDGRLLIRPRCIRLLLARLLFALRIVLKPTIRLVRRGSRFRCVALTWDTPPQRLASRCAPRWRLRLSWRRWSPSRCWKGRRRKFAPSRFVLRDRKVCGPPRNVRACTHPPQTYPLQSAALAQERQQTMSSSRALGSVTLLKNNPTKTPESPENEISSSLVSLVVIRLHAVVADSSPSCTYAYPRTGYQVVCLSPCRWPTDSQKLRCTRLSTRHTRLSIKAGGRGRRTSSSVPHCR